MSLSATEGRSAEQLLKDGFEVEFDRKLLGPECENGRGSTAELVGLREILGI